MTVMAAADHAGPGAGSVPAARRAPGGLPGGDRAGLAAPGPGRASRRPAGRRRDAPGRFRALAEAWQVLGDPARRAAYDRALARERPARGPGARCGGRPGPARRAARRRWCGCRGRRCGRARSGWKAAPARHRGRTADEEDVRLAVLAGAGAAVPGPGPGPAVVNPGVGGPGPGPVQHLGGRRAGRAAPADAADLRAGGAAGPGPQRGRHPPVLPPGHRPAGRRSAR